MMDEPIFTPTIEDRALYVQHDMPCPVHHGGYDPDYPTEGVISRKQCKAVLNMDEWVFEPSDVAKSEGWRLVCIAPGQRLPFWRRVKNAWKYVVFGELSNYGHFETTIVGPDRIPHLIEWLNDLPNGFKINM